MILFIVCAWPQKFYENGSSLFYLSYSLSSEGFGCALHYMCLGISAHMSPLECRVTPTHNKLERVQCMQCNQAGRARAGSTIRIYSTLLECIIRVTAHCCIRQDLIGAWLDTTLNQGTTIPLLNQGYLDWTLSSGLSFPLWLIIHFAIPPFSVL